MFRQLTCFVRIACAAACLTTASAALLGIDATRLSLVIVWSLGCRFQRRRNDERHVFDGRHDRQCRRFQYRHDRWGEAGRHHLRFIRTNDRRYDRVGAEHLPSVQSNSLLQSGIGLRERPDLPGDVLLALNRASYECRNCSPSASSSAAKSCPRSRRCPNRPPGRCCLSASPVSVPCLPAGNARSSADRSASSAKATARPPRAVLFEYCAVFGIQRRRRHMR